MKEMKTIELKGSSFEIGCQHGEVLRDEIHEFHATVFEVHRANLAQQAAEEELRSFCNRNLACLREFSSELYSEMEGIAAGSGLDLEDILFLNSFLELEDIRPPALGSKLLDAQHWGCTSFNVQPSASADGTAYVGQTYDMEEYYSRFNTVLHIVHENGQVQLVYTLAGVLGMNGMNSDGIGVTINKVVANDACEGVIYPFCVRQALAQRRIGDAFGVLVFTPRASGLNYQLASSEGVAWCIEVSARDYHLWPVDGAVVHTNHYLNDYMRKYETSGWLSHGGSYVRYQVGQRILDEAKGHIDLSLLKDLTKNHTNWPRCICAHGFEGEDPQHAFGTIATTIYDLTTETMYVCHRNACDNGFQKIELQGANGCTE